MLTTTYTASIMVKSKVGFHLTRFGWFGFAKHWVLAKMVIIQFVLEGGVRGFGEHALFFQNGQDTHRL